MISPVFALILCCALFANTARVTELKFSSSVHHKGTFVSVKTGDNLTLKCSYEGKVPAELYWYKQTLGQKPRLISSYYEYENVTFHGKFKNNPRFTLDTENGKNHLTITDLRISDSATYNCMNYLYTLEFYESITVSVEGSGLTLPALVHQSSSETIQPGGSVTLKCTVHTGTCDGEHSVYWFKNSEKSQPGVIYTHGDRNDQCERKPNTNICVYNLPMKSLNHSHAGTYYCAVASCGHILFGNGTKLDFENEVDYLILVYFLTTALTLATIVIVLLFFFTCKMMRRNSSQSTETGPQVRFQASFTASAEDYQEADNLLYSALQLNLPNESRRQRNNANNECIYSNVKQ